ncbi:MAG TPA: LLM class flavin-dependent oxidoreductase [Methylomirabilota bacterium]|nr:LLM class flavin-dependent oxidoreductase [Methylomirabilota bacterium]
MQVGIFLEERRPGTSEGGSLQETLELADLAEAWGLDGVWLGEIHFNPTRSVHSAPVALASFIAGRTRRVRVGTAVQVLPLGNPLRIAEEVATVDHLSQGRFDFGVGRSGSPRAYDVLGVPYGESQARFEEALEIILRSWKGEPFSFHGKFFHFENTRVAPSPYQRPHPPIRMAANSPETFPVVARLGLQLFAGLRDLGIPELKRYVADYRAAWRQAGHPGRGDVCVRIPIYLAPTEREAIEEPRDNMVYFFRRHAEIVRGGVGRTDTGPADRRRARLDEIAGLTYDDILATRVAFGTPASVAERLRRLRGELDIDGIVAELNPSGLFPMERMQRTLRILTHDVMPALKGP